MKVLFFVSHSDLLILILFFGELYNQYDWTFRLADKSSQAAEMIRQEDFGLIIWDESLVSDRFFRHVESVAAKAVFAVLSDHQDFTKARIVYVERTALEKSLQAQASFFQRVLLQREHYPLVIQKSLIEVPYRRIVYLEKEGRFVLFHTQLGLFRKRMTLKEIAPLFLDHGFIRIHSSFIVNPRFISARKRDEIQVDNKEWLPLSRVHQKEF